MTSPPTVSLQAQIEAVEHVAGFAHDRELQAAAATLRAYADMRDRQSVQEPLPKDMLHQSAVESVEASSLALSGRKPPGWAAGTPQSPADAKLAALREWHRRCAARQSSLATLWEDEPALHAYYCKSAARHQETAAALDAALSPSSAAQTQPIVAYYNASPQQQEYAHAEARRFGYEPGKLQWKWRDPATLPSNFDQRECEAALLDALVEMGSCAVWSGDGLGCAAQIVGAVWNRPRTEPSSAAGETKGGDSTEHGNRSSNGLASEHTVVPGERASGQHAPQPEQAGATMTDDIERLLKEADTSVNSGLHASPGWASLVRDLADALRRTAEDAERFRYLALDVDSNSTDMASYHKVKFVRGKPGQSFVDAIDAARRTSEEGE